MFYLQINDRRVSEAQDEIKTPHGEIMMTIQQSDDRKLLVVPGKFSIELKNEAKDLIIRVRNNATKKIIIYS